MVSLRVVAGALVLAAVGFAPPRAAGDQIVADFDAGAPLAPPFPQNVVLNIERDGDGGPTGTDRIARVLPKEDVAPGRPRAVIFRLGEGVDPAASAGVAANLRAVGAADDGVTLRWMALDEKDRPVLQRKFDLKSDGDAGDVVLPWHNWRWGNTLGGTRAEVRKLALVIESAVPELRVDDVRLVAPAADAPSPTDWLRRVAFGERDVRMAEADGLLVATDATDGLKEADLQRALSRMRKARAVVRRVFADSVRPIDDKAAAPAALLIFKDPKDYVGFAKRLGDEWAVTIAPPAGQGNTVQDVAASTYDPKQGADRPVFFHESVHAVVAHDVRLLTHHDHQSWLHEGLAAYLQVCVFPKSLDAAPLAGHFGKPIPADGRGFFVPLNGLLTKHVSTRHYAQLATLVAYLVEERPQWFPVIARELTDGKSVDQALEACGTSVAELEAEWFKWGKARFAERGRGAKPPFPKPPEFE